jgi:hypothetical protein
MACRDKSITFLKSFGYNVIRLPKADIAPLQIFIEKKGILQPLGNLASVLKPGEGAVIPPIKRDVTVATFNGRKTGDLSLGLGLNILGNIIGAMGGSKLGLEAGYSKAKTIVFSYGDVLEDSIEITELDKYLANSDVDPSSRYVGELLEANEIFVLTSTIKTNKVTVEGKGKNSTEAKVDVPVIKEIVGGNIEIKSNNEADSSVTFAGNIPLVFGFKAVRLFYEDGEYKRFDPVTDGSMTVAVSPHDKSLYVIESPLVNL